MAIYRARPGDGIAWLTGGSSGIGRALALELARQGYTVAVTTRPGDSLDELVEDAARLAGGILPFHCDVTDEAGMAATVTAIEKKAGPIILAIFNAGTYIPVHGEALDIADFRATYEVNLFGVLNGLVPVVDSMRRRGRGHIVLNGSVTAYMGWPTAAAYGATKAALNNMAEALRFDFYKLNIRIQIINPGFVDTPLIRRRKHLTPALMPVDKASLRIARAIRSGGFETNFPRRFTVWLKLLRALPRGPVFSFLNYATAWKARPARPRLPPDA